MEKSKLSLIALFAIAFAPAPALAQSIGDIITRIGAILNALVPLLITAAIVVFFWGLVTYIFNQSNEDKKSQGRSVMYMGLIALFVMVSVWGIIKVLGNTLGIEQGGQVPVPQVPIGR